MHTDVSLQKGYVLFFHLFFIQTERLDDPCILDLAFIIDASGSIKPYWEDVRKFAAGVAKLVNISSDGSHVGVVKFGETSKIEFGFNEGQNENTVVRNLLNLDPPVPGSRTMLHSALEKANDDLFNPQTNSFREDPNVRKVRRFISPLMEI